MLEIELRNLRNLTNLIDEFYFIVQCKLVTILGSNGGDQSDQKQQQQADTLHGVELSRNDSLSMMHLG